jgi:hypothetical protein
LFHTTQVQVSFSERAVLTEALKLFGNDRFRDLSRITESDLPHYKAMLRQQYA